MEAFLVSTGLVALAEMGDRTQLLAIMLASRFKRPIPILLGILLATIASNVLAAVAGFYLSNLLTSIWFKYAVALSFIGMAMWTLVPDKAEDEDKPPRAGLGVFLATAVSFFVVEIGDKTQIAAAALAAQFHNILLVAAGTTTGMMLANIPAVFLGHRFSRAIPMTLLRVVAAVVYLALGLWSMARAAGFLN